MAFGNGFSVGSVVTVVGVVMIVVLFVEDKTGSVEVVTKNESVELSIVSSLNKSGFATKTVMPKIEEPYLIKPINLYHLIQIR